MTQPLLDRPARTAVVSVVATGASLAGTGLVASLAHEQRGQAAAYVVVMAVLSGVAVLVWRNVRWVTIVCLVGLAGQGIAVVGTVWELAHPIATAKSVQLEAVGINPTAATVINLVYSAIAFGVFCGIVVRRRTRNRSGPAQRVQPMAHDSEKEAAP